MLASVEKMIDRVVAVTARDERRRRAERDEPLGELRTRPLAREGARLGQVGRHDRGEREEQRHERGDRIVLEQPRTRRGDQYGVDDERSPMSREERSHHLDHTARVEHPRLRSVDTDVRVDRLELREDEGRRHLVHGGDARRVLGGQGDDRRHSMRAGCGERLQVGLDPCAAAAVRAGDRQCSRNHLRQRSLRRF